MKNELSNQKTGCVIMASGLSTRYGKNKLFELFQGQTFLARTLNTVSSVSFDACVTVTRNREAADYCRTVQMPVILHDLPGRNDTIRLGTSYLQQMDRLMFCPCDQPFLSPSSLQKMLDYPDWNDDFILRLGYENRAGAPVLFGKKYFPMLCSLPDKKGGSYLIHKYPGNIKILSAESELELLDIDTPEDFSRL